MAAPMVTSSITLRSGERQEYSHLAQSVNGQITYQKLRESLQTLQNEVNGFLTLQVELEKGQQTNSRGDSQDEEEDEDDEDGDDAEGDGNAADENLSSNEPPKKKPKK